MGQASGPHTCLGTLLQSVDLESLEFAWVDIQHGREIDLKVHVFLLDMCKKLLNALCSRSVSKIDLRSQQKFQWHMNFWGKSYQKIENSKKSTEGT